MSKRLAVSIEFIRAGRVGGAEEMVHGVVEGLAAALGCGDELVVFGDANGRLNARAEYSKPPRTSRNRFLQERSTFRAFAASFDGWLFPNYHTPWNGGRCRVVTVIHDLQYLHFPENFSPLKRLWLRHALKATLDRADQVVVPSKFVMEDVVGSFGAGVERKLSIIPNPISWHRMEGSEDPSSGPPYILAVAAHYPHKNLSTLLRAFRIIVDRRPEMRLVLVGQLARNLLGMRAGSNIAVLVAQLGLEQFVTVTGFVSRTELGRWYRGAEVFVFPSLFEGFGMPPVEAIGFGLPVVTTRCGSIPEVTFEAATYLEDPLDVVHMADRIIDVLDDRSRYTPSRDLVKTIRETYAPSRIGRLHYSALVGDGRD